MVWWKRDQRPCESCSPHLHEYTSVQPHQCSGKCYHSAWHCSSDTIHTAATNNLRRCAMTWVGTASHVCWLPDHEIEGTMSFQTSVERVWNVIAHAQKPDFVIRAKRTRPFKSARWAGRQFSRLLEAEVCAISGSNAGYIVFRGSVKSTGYTLHSPVFPLQLPSRASPWSITFQLESNAGYIVFRGSVKSTGYPLLSPVFSLQFPFRASPCAITFQLESNAGYNMFRGSVKSTGYRLHSPVSPSCPLQCVTVCHHISTGV